MKVCVRIARAVLPLRELKHSLQRGLGQLGTAGEGCRWGKDWWLSTVTYLVMVKFLPCFAGMGLTVSTEGTLQKKKKSC